MSFPPRQPELHYKSKNEENTSISTQCLIWWQDPLSGEWSPERLITWGRGYACVSLGFNLEPVWVPNWRIKPYHERPKEKTHPVGH